MTTGGRLQSALEQGDFVITAEVTPRLASSEEDLLAIARPFKSIVEAVNVTDGAGARVAMSSLAASAILVRDDIEPVLQITCRDRNRIAIASDLIGAAALGIQNVLILGGDDPKSGDEPDAKGVFDLTSRDVIALAHGMSDYGVIASGRKLSSRPEFTIGAADAPFDAPKGWKPDGLRAKIASGIDFVQTQFCFEPAIAKKYLKRLEDLGVLPGPAILIGVGPFASARSAQWMHDNLFGVTVPDALVKRMQTSADPVREGEKIFAELIDAYREMPGVAGVHVMAPAHESEHVADMISEIPGRR